MAGAQNYLKWDAGQITASTPDPDGGPWCLTQVNTYGDAGGQPMLAHYPYGHYARPLDPGDDGDACQALYCYEGDQGHVWPTLDTRALEKLPPLNKGASVQYGSDGGFAQFDPKTNTWTVYQPVEFDGEGTPTKAHSITVGKAGDGSPILSLIHANGMGLLMQDDGKNSVTLKNAPGTAGLFTDDDGQLALVGALRITSGFSAGSPAAVPLARAPEVLTWATAVVAQVNAWALNVVTTVNAAVTAVNGLAPGSVPAPLAPMAPLPPLPASVASLMAKSD
jgi:hypothetical protein